MLLKIIILWSVSSSARAGDLHGVLYLTDFCDKRKWRLLLSAQGVCPSQATEAEQPVRIPRESTMLSMAQWNGAFLLPGPAINTSFCAIPQAFQKDPAAPPLVLFRAGHRWRQKGEEFRRRRKSDLGAVVFGWLAGGRDPL